MFQWVPAICVVHWVLRKNPECLQRSAEHQQMEADSNTLRLQIYVRAATSAAELTASDAQERKEELKWIFPKQNHTIKDR